MSRLNRKRLISVLPWGLLLGVALTYASTSQMNWETVAGCRQTIYGPKLAHQLASCEVLEEGYPSRFLSSSAWLTQDSGRVSSIRAISIAGQPSINKVNLLEDWFVWTLVSCSGFYLATSSLSERGVAFEGAGRAADPRP
jgi:hypothetical protein